MTVASDLETMRESATAARLRVCFVMEQAVGHVTVYQNLRVALAERDDLEAHWVESHMYRPGGVFERVPGLPLVLRASARALVDVRHAIRSHAPDVLFFNTQLSAAFCQWYMRRTPTILMTDVTP